MPWQAIHSTVKFAYIYRSSHTFARKFWIHVEMFYQTFNLVFSWFALVRHVAGFLQACHWLIPTFIQGNYYVSFIILTDALEDKSLNLGRIDIVNTILHYFYLVLVVMCFLLALGNRPQGSKFGYTLAMIGFAIITVYMTVR
jgi:chitin synthase